MEEKKTVIIAGAGAAGLMAAISAARAGAQVTVLEAMERPGKKLLLTGNGRCNLTNLNPALAESYYGTGAKTASYVIGQFDTKDMLAFFGELGLLVQEKNGYVYPYSSQSGSVLSVLLTEAKRLKVKLKYSEKIIEIKRETKNPSVSDTSKENSVPVTSNHSEYDSRWAVRTQSWCYYGDAVILACGSKAVPSTGSDGSGYALAKGLGHTIRKVAPALVPLTCEGKFLPLLAGVRCRAEVSLWEQPAAGQNFFKTEHAEKGSEKNAAGQPCMKLIQKETGELQWTKYGVSGIVVFQLSRFVSLAKPNTKQYLKINFLPESGNELLQILTRRAAMLGDEKAGTLLTGMLNDKLIPVILERADRSVKAKKALAKTVCQNLLPEQIAAIFQEIKQFTLEVTGTKSFDVAQVCAGGVDCSEIEEQTLESKLQSQLYFAGEILDVDGPCGGYNLQWAWSSGYLAGKSAAGKKCAAHNQTFSEKTVKNHDNQNKRIKTAPGSHQT